MLFSYYVSYNLIIFSCAKIKNKKSAIYLNMSWASPLGNKAD
jgi:hypothetical protein